MLVVIWTVEERVSLEQFEQRVRTIVQQRGTPGLSVVVVRGSDIVMARGYGWSDLQNRTAATPETVYLYCSMTKLFTATAVMQLHERGLIELDKPVRSYLPRFPLSHSSGREITIRHLLSHSSGIANPIPLSWVHLANEPAVDLDDLTGRLLARHRRLRFEPGSRYAYSNLGYLVLGQVIEQLSGRSYADYVREHVLGLLDMLKTGFTYDELHDEEVATGYVRSRSLTSLLIRLMVHKPVLLRSTQGYTAFNRFLIDGAPYGGLLGPVVELGGFLGAYLSNGGFRGRRLLEPSSVTEMTAPQLDNNGEELSTGGRAETEHVGLGWHLAGDGEIRSCYHIGGGGGYRSELRIYPRLGRGICVMSNETNFVTGAITGLVLSDNSTGVGKWTT